MRVGRTSLLGMSCGIRICLDFLGGGVSHGTESKSSAASAVPSSPAGFRFAPKTLGYDRDVVINTYEAAARIVPTGRSAPVSRIEIVVFAGRSLDAERAQYQVLVAICLRSGFA